MALKLGATTLTALYLGSTAISAAYLGSTQVYSTGGAFSPATLFASGEEGAWYEPSTTTCFTDTGGTVAATYGDGVAYLQDLSGNGNHATQVTAGARPILARVPEGGRRNLFERTESLGTSPWGGFGTTATSAPSELDPNGNTGTVTRVTSDGSAFQTRFQNRVLVSGETYTISAWVKRATGTNQEFKFFCSNDQVSDDFTAGSTWQRVTYTFVATQSGSTANGFSDNAAGDVYDIYVFGVQLEAGSTATAYQKVVDEYDITEAGVTSLEYLSFDGADDFLINDAISVPRPVNVFAAWETDRVKTQSAIDTRNSTLRFFIGPNNGSNVFSSDPSGSLLKSLSANTPYVASALGASPLGDDFRIDGASVGTRTGGTHGFNGLTIGDIRNAVASGYKLDGKIFGLIVRGASSTAQEISDTEAYLAARSGVSI